MPVVNESTKKMSDFIREQLVAGVAVTSGNITDKGDIYKASLALSGTNEEEVERVHGHDETFIAGALHATGMIALEQMKADENITAVNVHLGMAGKNHLDTQVLRSKTYPGMTRVNDDGEKTTSPDVTKHGVFNGFAYTVAGARNVGQLAAAREEVGNAFSAAFMAAQSAD